MEIIPTASASTQALGAARSIDEYAASAGRYLHAGLQGAPNTQKAYAGDWKRFAAWCTDHGRAALPADVPTVAAFVTALADAGKKVATIQRHCAALSKAHHLAGLPTPLDDRQLKSLLEGISREKGVRQKQAKAFTLPYFKHVVTGIGTDRLEGIRDRALLLLGFAGAFRREELTAIDVEHLQFDDDSFELVVHLPKSKTNQKGEPEEKAIFSSAVRETCPVLAVQAWLRVLHEHGRTGGPLFVSLRRGQHLSHQRLTPVSVNQIVQARLGITYSAHSLRASFVTIAKLAGADDSEVMNQTKHKTTAMIRRYTRLENVRQHNAGRKLGL